MAVYNILKGSSNNFTSVWADVTAGVNNGKFYVASSAAFSVVDSSVPSIYDFYTQTYPGRANEVLDNTNIIDINVSGV